MKTRNFLMLMLSLICFAFMPNLSAQVKEYKQEKYYYGQKGEGKIQVMDNKGRFVLKDIEQLVPSDLVVTDSLTQGQLMRFDTTNGWQAASRSDVLGYKEYVALLSQTGTSAPVATVLYNDLGGAVVWTRQEAGLYIGTLAGAFTVNKTYISPQFSQISPAAVDDVLVNFQPASATIVEMTVSSGGVASDDFINSYMITIRVYN